MSTLSRSIAHDNDDGATHSGGWGVDHVLVFGNDNGTPCVTALRFNNITIDSGSTISSASITVYSRNNWIEPNIYNKVYGIDEDDTANFSSDPTGRSKTTAAVDWDMDDTPGNENVPVVSPDIGSTIQEIINRGGWSSGNDMGFLIKDDGTPNNDYESAFRHENIVGGIYAKLDITYTVGTTTTSTSTSSSTSTSTSTSSSTTTQTPDPNYAQGIMRITKEGKDVIDSNYLDDYFLDSNYPLLKVHDSGSFTTSIIGLEDIPHTLGYIPYAIVFSQYIEDAGFGGVNITSEYYQHDWFLTGAAYYSYGYTKIYDDELKIVIENINTPRPGTIDGFYYIFKEAVI